MKKEQHWLSKEETRQGRMLQEKREESRRRPGGRVDMSLFDHHRYRLQASGMFHMISGVIAREGRSFRCQSQG